MLLARMLMDSIEEGTTLMSPSVHRWPCSTCSIISSLANMPMSVGKVLMSHQPASALNLMRSAMLRMGTRNSRVTAEYRALKADRMRFPTACEAGG